MYNNGQFVFDMGHYGFSKPQNLNVGLFSIDQEKAFDRVDHIYLFKTFEAFCFNNLTKVYFMGEVTVFGCYCVVEGRGRT